jgi:hypothetical protein
MTYAQVVLASWCGTKLRVEADNSLHLPFGHAQAGRQLVNGIGGYIADRALYLLKGYLEHLRAARIARDDIVDLFHA